MPRILARAFLPLAALATGAWLATALAEEPLAARVLILANRDDPDSLAIAGHYLQARQVPPDNLFAYSIPGAETISWGQFIATLWQPLQDELVRRRWIDAIPLASLDAVGRRKYAVSGHRIAALVVCRGVPLRIDDDSTLRAEAFAVSARSELRTNAGAVDSELSLLAADGGYPIDGFVANPLFGKLRPSEFDRAKVVKVSRLDGPTAADALALIDRALAAERTGLAGRAYVDKGGDYAEGNRWLEDTAKQITALGFDLAVNRASETMPASDRCDAPVLYFGWHTPDLNGPFALPGFGFPVGAVVLHIHSYSAHTLRSAAEGWSGPLVARGVTATAGNVFEPYLQFTHRPDFLFRALARGDNLVDAAYYALPVLSWQGVLIGDPLYRPFSVPLAEQLAHLDRVPAGLAGYAVLREARLMESAGEPVQAMALMRNELGQRPNLALALAIAERLQKAGRTSEAAQVLEPNLPSTPLPADQWGLAHDTARFLAEINHASLAITMYRRIFAVGALPLQLRARWLVEARQTALNAHDPAQGAAWKQALDQVVGAMLREK